MVNNNLEINIDCIKLAFEINKKIKSQRIAYDFVFDSNNNPLLLEVSFGFKIVAYYPCPGYWDSELKWHSGSFSPVDWQIENLLGPREDNTL